VTLHVHTRDVDRPVAHVLAAGGPVERPLADAFHGARLGQIRDPCGHEWPLGGEIEKLTTDEMQRRYTALFEGKE
jgi:uncharacterized glyoxalase superfamily protein PhnB